MSYQNNPLKEIKMNTKNLLQSFIKNDLPNYTNEYLVERLFDFRDRNSTSQGLYSYIKWSSDRQKEIQDELRDMLSDTLCDLYQDLYCDYSDKLYDLSLKEEWFKEDMEQEGLEENTDEYYEMWWEYLNDYDLVSPITLLDLVFFDLIEDYYEELQETDPLEPVLMGLLHDNGIDPYDFDEVYSDFDYEKMEWVFIEDETYNELTLEEVKEKVKNFQLDLVD